MKVKQGTKFEVYYFAPENKLVLVSHMPNKPKFKVLNMIVLDRETKTDLKGYLIPLGLLAWYTAKGNAIHLGAL